MSCETPFQKAGYVPYDTFVITDSITQFAKGSIVKLAYDDGSSCPSFKLIQGVCAFLDNTAFVELNSLIKIISNQTPFERAGFKPDDTFILVENRGELLKGTQVILYDDEGTKDPLFKVISTTISSYGKLYNIDLDKLIKHLD